jgi:hypothetical protein
MYARPEGIEVRRNRRSTVWLGAGILLITTLASALIGRGQPVTRDLVMATAAIVALGTFAIGWVNSRVSPYPRWIWFASATAMGLVVMAGAAMVEPAKWVDDVRPTTWMLPWFLLTWGSVSPAKSGLCAPGHPRTAWIMVVGSLLLATFLTSIPLVADWVRGR